MKFLYEETIDVLKFDPQAPVNVPPVTKREKGKAWRLTNRVWADICGQGVNDGTESVGVDAIAT